jgi:hypothetical protein
VRYEFVSPAPSGRKAGDGSGSSLPESSPPSDDLLPNADLFWGFALIVAPIKWTNAPGSTAARASELERLVDGSSISWPAGAASLPAVSDAPASVTGAQPLSSPAIASDSAASSVMRRLLLRSLEGDTSATGGAAPAPPTQPTKPVLSPSQLAVLLSRVPYEIDCLLVQWVNLHTAHGLGAEVDDRAGASRRTVARALDIGPSGESSTCAV